MIAESSLRVSAVEGKQRAKSEKVAGVVPGVENGVENMRAPVGDHRILQSCIDLTSEGVRSAGCISKVFWGIDFVPRVGYASRTFAVRALNDYWRKLWNGQHLLLKKFA
jgi:hypothetical protein